MSLQFRRGTTSSIAIITPLEGEPIYATDTKEFFIGDGSTAGGIKIGAGTDPTFNSVTVTTTATVGSLSTTGNIDGAEGFTANMTGFRAGWYGGTAGYAFKSDTDTGMFANGTGDLRFKIDGNNAVLVDSTGWDFQNNIWVTNTATVATLKFGDGTTMTTAPINEADQSLNTTSNVRFESVAVGTGTTSVGTVFDNDSSMLLTADQGVYISAPFGLNIDSNTSGGLAGSRLYVNSIQVSGTATEVSVNSPLNINNTLTANQLLIGDPASSQLNISKSGGAFVIGSENSSDSIRINQHNYLYLDPNSAVIINESNPGQSFLNVNTIRPSGTYTNVTFNSTITVGGMTIGLNNDAVVMPAATVASSATTVLFQTIPGAGGNIIFNMNRFGVAWPLAITRTGGIAFSHGQQIFPGQTTNVGALSVQAGSTSTGTTNQLFLSSGGITGSGPLTRGVFNDGTGFTVGTRPSGGATAFNSSVFDLNGGLTLPKSINVGTTATVASLSVTNTATANEVVVGADLQAIKSQGYNVIGVDGNWHVGNVLEVGTGDGNGYITSTGNNSLTLQTSGNNGPGGSIVIGTGDGAGVSLYSGNSQEFQTAQFNTTSNTINYGLTVNGASSFNDTLTIKGFKETIYDWGSVGAGTYTPDVNSGTVHKMVLTGDVTISALTNVTAGRSINLILTQDGVGGRLLTSTMLFAGGSKTLSTAAGAIDTVSVFYDGTNYLASLVKGYA